MTRISLAALTGILLLAHPATCSPQDAPTNEAAWARAVNLLALVDPEKDAVSSDWKIEDGALVSCEKGSDNSPIAIIQIPFQPPPEYDFRITFTRLSGSDVLQILAKGTRSFAWVMGVDNGREFGFSRVKGEHVHSAKNPTTVEPGRLKNKQRYTSVVSVRNDRVAAYLDGSLVTQWRTRYHDITTFRDYTLPDPSLLGLGSYRSSTIFHSVELLEITDKGKIVARRTIARVGGEGGKPKPLANPAKNVVKQTEEREPKKTEPAPMADPELQKSAKPFACNQASIKGLYVVRTEAGLRVGGSQDIIATAERASSDRETICDFVTEVGKDTDISMEEAARLLKVRYPVWQAGYKIRFSYSNKYTKQAGGSAGGAFSVLLLSLLDGVQIDPAFAMTGDVTVDGKIREVGAVAEKIRGATLDRCRVIAIPEANKESLNDLVILYSQAMLWSAQIFSIVTLDDAAAVARVDRKPELAKAMELFGQVQRSLGANATPFALRSPGIVQTLQQVLQLAPNHLSAEFMLRAAGGRMPQTLGLGGSLEEIWAAAGPLLGFLFSDYKEPEKSKRYYFDKVPTATFKAGMERLNWLQFRLHPKTQALKMAMAEYMTSLDQMHRASSFSAGSLRQHLLKRDKVLSEAHTLGTDRKTLEEMLH